MATTTNIETEAFVVEEPNAPFKLTPIIIDEMRDDEYLIEMKYSGICHTVNTLVIWVQFRTGLSAVYRAVRTFEAGSRGTA